MITPPPPFPPPPPPSSPLLLFLSFPYPYVRAHRGGGLMMADMTPMEAEAAKKGLFFFFFFFSSHPVADRPRLEEGLAVRVMSLFFFWCSADAHTKR